jgi:3-oxoacyl-[acyl-carrier-protein] synthase-1
MMNGGFIAPNINYEEGDEITSRLNIVNKTMNCQLDTVLSNSFGFGGTNAALILKKI